MKKTWRYPLPAHRFRGILRSLMASYSAIITSAEVIIAGGQIFKMAASLFVDVSEEEIN